MKKIYSAKDIARYILSLCELEVGDSITNLKLQKLLYYCQGFSLAMYDKPLFKEKVLAWMYGPVVEEVYQEYKNFGAYSIQFEEPVNIDIYDKNTQEIINQVYEVYGQFSAWKLKNMTHEEKPWKETLINEEIKHSLMKDYFKTLLVDE